MCADVSSTVCSPGKPLVQALHCIHVTNSLTVVVISFTFMRKAPQVVAI